MRRTRWLIAVLGILSLTILAPVFAGAPPTAVVTEPFEGQQYPWCQPGSVGTKCVRAHYFGVTGDATDDVGIVRMEFYADGRLFCASEWPPVHLTSTSSVCVWSIHSGEHTFQIRVTDEEGNSTLSAPVTATFGVR